MIINGEKVDTRYPNRHHLYSIWLGIKTRCYNPNHVYYKYYGGKGVIMCEDWKNNFSSFYIWAIENGYQDGEFISRNDANGDYQPDNCKLQRTQPSKEAIIKQKPVKIKEENKQKKPMVVKSKIQDKQVKPRKTRMPKYKVKTGFPGRHPIYSTWWGIKTRCYNSHSDAYMYYGARGITMCDEWKNDFNSFYDWMIDNGWENGLVVDRKDNDKPYSPDNCQLITDSLNSMKKNYQMFFSPGGEFNKSSYDAYSNKLRTALTK